MGTNASNFKLRVIEGKKEIASDKYGPVSTPHFSIFGQETYSATSADTPYGGEPIGPVI